MIERDRDIELKTVIRRGIQTRVKEGGGQEKRRQRNRERWR